MAELRRDPVSGHWVIMAAERAPRPRDSWVQRPEARGGFCPFCEGNEDRTPPEITAVRREDTEPNKPGWSVRVVPNKFPALSAEGEVHKWRDGLYQTMNGVGNHEIIIESPRHAASLTDLEPEQIENVLWTCRDRALALKNDGRFIHASIFKNVGQQAGASLEHSHSQMICTPVVPKRVQEEMRRCKEFYRRRDRCLFCDIGGQEIADGRRIVIDGEQFLCIAPYASRFPFEMWLLPKRHSANFHSIERHEAAELGRLLRGAVAGLEGALTEPPYNCIIHSAPLDVGEIPYYHWHIEIIPRVTALAGFEWGTGFYINPLTPERAAEYLRDGPGQRPTDEVTTSLTSWRPS